MDWSDNAWRIKWTRFYRNLFWINLMKKEYSTQQQNIRKSGFSVCRQYPACAGWNAIFVGS